MAGYQVMPRLTPDEYAELEQSIIDNGVQVPITVDQHGVIVDGHHRDEIARKHALHCPRVTADGDEAKLRGLAFSLNLHRRHLNREQKRELVDASLIADPKLTDREHGRRTGVSPQTITKARKELESNAQIEHYAPGDRVEASGRAARGSSGASTFNCWSCQETRPLDEHTEVPEGRLCNDCIEEYDTPPAQLEDDRFISADELDALNQPKPDRDADHLHVPKVKRRQPITDWASKIVYDIGHNIERLEAVMADDRYPQYADEIRKRHREELHEAANIIKQLLQEQAL